MSSPPTDPPSDTAAPPQKQAESGGDLFSSAKLVAGAFQAAYSGEADTIDKPKVATAASELLGAASEYGHLDQQGMGQYVQKAEDYLQQYGSGEAAKPAEGEKSGEGYGQYLKMAEGVLGGKSGDGEKKEEESSGGGGFGGYMKAAHGFFK